MKLNIAASMILLLMAFGCGTKDGGPSSGVAGVETPKLAKPPQAVEPDPIAEFRKVVAEIEQRISRRYTQVTLIGVRPDGKGEYWTKQSFSFINVKYDILKSNSVINPMTAFVSADLTRSVYSRKRLKLQSDLTPAERSQALSEGMEDAVYRLNATTGKGGNAPLRLGRQPLLGPNVFISTPLFDSEEDATRATEFQEERATFKAKYTWADGKWQVLANYGSGPQENLPVEIVGHGRLPLGHPFVDDPDFKLLNNFKVVR